MFHTLTKMYTVTTNLTTDFNANLQTKLEDNNNIASNPRKKRLW